MFFCSSESDLRKALVRSKLAAAADSSSPSAPPASSAAPPPQCHLDELIRSDSMDSMLGDSLLDPPQSLQKMPPKRYQSPSRCGSPSVEAPEHLLFGNKRGMLDYSSHRLTPASERCARQDLLRRRDLNLYHGLHPRLLHSGGPTPRLSLPPRGAGGGRGCDGSDSPRLCRPLRPDRTMEKGDHWLPVDDRMHVRDFKTFLCCKLEIYIVIFDLLRLTVQFRVSTCAPSTRTRTKQLRDMRLSNVSRCVLSSLLPGFPRVPVAGRVGPTSIE